MRLLCVAEAYPWPPKDGYRLRLSNLIGGLLEVGSVDFLCLDGSASERDPAPAGVSVIDAPESPESSASSWMPSWLSSREPRRLVRRNFPVARQTLADLDAGVPGRYDVVVFSHVDSWAQTWDLVDAPSIIDFDNLENLALKGIREVGPVVGPSPTTAEKVVARARWVVASGFNLTDEHRWDETQRRAASCVNRAVVCSDLDVGRSGCGNVVTIPNGYELPWEAADHTAVIDPDHPVFLFIGLMTYSPNSDAAQWFATDVMPRILRRVPGAEFRIVGRGTEAVAHLGELPGVTVVGSVDTLEGELRGADVSVVPIRSGAGTRLKVIEAMANRLPMVSTPVGCEGIDLMPGEHLLVATDSAAFADACVTAVSDQSLRTKLIEAAETRFVDRYQWSTIRAQVAALAREVSAERRPTSDVHRMD